MIAQNVIYIIWSTTYNFKKKFTSSYIIHCQQRIFFNISITFLQVDYLGSVFLSNRSSDLFSLQKPLKSLYFKYLETKLTGSAEDEVKLGTLEITQSGLKVRQAYFTTIIQFTTLLGMKKNKVFFNHQAYSKTLTTGTLPDIK